MTPVVDRRRVTTSRVFVVERVAHALQCEARMQTINVEVLALVTGGAGVNQSWSQIRAQAAPYCPQTAAKFPAAPKTRAQAQGIGNACLSEMGSFKASFARDRINGAIDEAFPR